MRYRSRTPRRLDDKASNQRSRKISDEKKIEKFEQKAEEARQAGEELSRDELEAEVGENLPDREAMSLVDANVAAPVNAAVAAKILSDDSTATATATQDVQIDQSNE